jgi:hypothetical protein
MYALRVPSVSFSVVRLLLAIVAVTLTIAAHAQTIQGRVVGISDGDTITVLDAKRTQHKVRLAGIDAPESGKPSATSPKQQSGAAKADQNATQSQHGTEQNPVVIKVLPSPSDEAKAAKEQHHKDNEAIIADATVDLVWVTLALAIFTALLFGTTVFLARDARKTSERQAREMLESLDIARRSAESAKTSVDLFHDDFILKHRAWVYPEVSIAGPLTFEEDGGVAITLAVVLKIVEARQRFMSATVSRLFST